MKVDLTQKEIDIIYFRLKDYIKISNNVDYLNELTEVDKEEFKVELVQNIDLDNTFELTFKSSYNNLKSFYNKYYNTGETFEEYINN